MLKKTKNIKLVKKASLSPKLEEMLLKEVLGKGGLSQREIDKILEAVNTANQEEEEEVTEMFFPFNGGINGSEKELENRGIIFINDEISKSTLASASQKLLTYHFDPNFTDDIQIIINSPGGYLDACWAFVDTMNFVKNKIKTIALGEICSAAVLIFVAGDERIVSPHSVAMIHQASTHSAGNYGDLVADRKIQDVVQNQLIEHLVENSKYKTEKEVRQHLLLPNDNWLTPAEMKKHGLCDKVLVTRKKDRKATKVK